jgi:hypothetical protein
MVNYRYTVHVCDLFKDWEIENLNTKFCKYILGVNRRSTNIAILSELGKYPLHISLLVSIFSFWHRFQNKEDNSRLSNALKESIYLNNSGVNSWFSSITFLLIYFLCLVFFHICQFLYVNCVHLF